MVTIYTSREPSPKILVRMGVESMVKMVKITATLSVVIQRNIYRIFRPQLTKYILNINVTWRNSHTIRNA